MELVVIATKKKLGKEPMQLMLDEVAKQPQIRRLAIIELDDLRSATQLENAIEGIDLATAALIHKPHELFSFADERLLQAYIEIERRFYYVQDRLESIRRIHHRLDMHNTLSLLTAEGICTPSVCLLDGQLTDEALLWANAHSPFLLKPNDSNNHNLYLVKDASSLAALYPRVMDEAEQNKTERVSEAPAVNVTLLHHNNTYLIEQYMPHTIVFKIYTYRGTIIHTDFRAPLCLPKSFCQEEACEGYDASETSYRKINSQTCPDIQTSVAYNPTPAEWHLAQSIARLIYISLGLSILGIDALRTPSGFHIIDLNYFSGPKKADWLDLKNLLVLDLLTC